MEDRQIVDLFWQRSEEAIAKTQEKYGKYCRYIAKNILGSDEDAEECVNDTYVKVWNSIPPNRPVRLSAFIGKVTRNIALNRASYKNAKKRSGQTELVLDELLECVPATESTEQAVEEKLLVEVLNRFLHELPIEKRMMFLRRYWYLSSIKEIAEDYEISEGKVKMTLLRIRNKLKQTLEKEGIVL